MTAELRLLQAILRQDFRAFVEKVFLALTPGGKFVRSWHLDAIAYQLERIRRGEIKRLIINMPPRSLKSIMASVAFPAYVLGLDPTRRIICASYSGELAKKHSNDFRAVLSSPWYRSTFPKTKVGPFKNNETEIELTARGSRFATSIGGTLTGRGGDIIIIDDPLKPDDALSETKRSAANQWFTNTLLSRLDDKRTGAIVVVMQRVHMDDMTGFLTEQSDEWEVLNLPAIAEADQIVPCWEGKPYYRKAGEVLSPEREPLQVLNDLKMQIGSDAFYAQYQQMPVPPGGAMIKRHWIRRYDELPPQNEHLTILQSWDTANKGGPQNDWSVCTTWLIARGMRWFLIDVCRGRVDYPELKAMVQSLAKTWKARRVLVEDAGAGTMLVQELRSRVSGIVAIRPDGDKVSRMAVASSQFEAGQVMFPERAAWLADLEAELFAFPGSKHDDQCDSISQALLNSNLSFMQKMTPEQLTVMIAEIRKLKRPGPIRRRRWNHTLSRDQAHWR
jgi:predicted phage terminase large subunit-like protein